MNKQQLIKFLEKYPDDIELGIIRPSNEEMDWAPLVDGVAEFFGVNNQKLDGKRWLIFNVFRIGQTFPRLKRVDEHEKETKFLSFVGAEFPDEDFKLEFERYGMFHPSIITTISGQEIKWRINLSESGKLSYIDGSLGKHTFKDVKKMKEFFTKKKLELVECRMRELKKELKRRDSIKRHKL